MAGVNGIESVVFALVCLTVLFVNSGEAYLCYECDSLTYPGCADPMQKNYVNQKQCNDIAHFSQHPIGCAKTISKTGDGIKITRTCLTKAEEDQVFSDPTVICANRAYSSDTICRCYSDLCNRATTSVASLSPWILFLVFLLVQVIR